MLVAGLIISRFLHFTSVVVLFGMALFSFYAHPLAHGGEARWRPRAVIFMGTLIALLSAVCWFVFTAANMTDSLISAVAPDTLWRVLQSTAFGRLWVVRLFLAILLLIYAGYWLNKKRLPSPDFPMLLLSGALLVSLAGTGHAQADGGFAGYAHVGADAIHLLSAGAWLGGLIPLGNMLRRLDSQMAPHEVWDAIKVLNRFSRMGIIAVSLLVGSGLINSRFLIGSVSQLFEAAYGQLLLLKLGLFTAMILLAAANRFWLVPELQNATKTISTAVWITRLRRHVVSEQTLGLLVIVVVSLLGTMEPPIGPM